jgi:thiol-disulfide isomerase/thioredoxin
MKYRGALAIASVLLVLLAISARQNVARESEPYSIGSTVSPDIQFTDIYRKQHSFSDFRGKIVFMHFWSIVCPSERAAEPKCIELQKQYADKGVVEIAINANQRELKAAGNPPYANLRDHVEKAGGNFIVGVDPGNKLIDIFGARSTPHCFVIDKDGVLRYSGALDDDPRGNKGSQAVSYVKAAIDALLAGNSVAAPLTKPYG